MLQLQWKVVAYITRRVEQKVYIAHCKDIGLSICIRTKGGVIALPLYRLMAIDSGREPFTGATDGRSLL
jgi:hypothetical protein